jgi:DNA-binding MarR family transcriptional regulator
MYDLVERVQRVRLLLETLNDPYPTVRGALRSDSGPAASRYVPCETCRRTGWVRRRRNLESLCLACDGRGWRRRQVDEAEWDAYLELPVAEAVQLPTETTHRPLVQDDGGYGWERLQQAYERAGSYGEVRLRLEQLGAHHRRRYRLIRIVLVDGEPLVLARRDETELDLGVLWVTLRMRSIRVPAWLMEHEARTANLTVAALAADGYKPSQIAARLGMTKDAVKRTLRRQHQANGRRLGSTGDPGAGLVPDLSRASLP